MADAPRKLDHSLILTLLSEGRLIRGAWTGTDDAEEAE
jgi:hypothetical protein